jgi:hypothetical protein
MCGPVKRNVKHNHRAEGSDGRDVVEELFPEHLGCGPERRS